MRKHKFKTIGSNAVDGATTRGKTWGFIPVSGKGGQTHNSTITEAMHEKAYKLFLKGGAANA